MYRYYKKCRPSPPRLFLLSDSKWIINIRRNVSVNIKNFVLDDSERLICVSLSTRQFFFIINSLGKSWKKRRFAGELLFIFGFNYSQKDTTLSTIFFFKKIVNCVEKVNIRKKSNKQLISTDN